MSLSYLVDIQNPHQHIVRVTLKIEHFKGEKCSFFLPSWSPGSYLMREYARHIRRLECHSDKGEALFFTQKAKGLWEIDLAQSETSQRSFLISYEIYCKDLTVRTSHVDASHAFLHGPSYLIGVKDLESQRPQIEFRFPESWSKLSTGLKDISKIRNHFLYEARNYDELIDCPVEIGCHETDGFLVGGKSHNLAFYGEIYPHKNPLKEDYKKIVETVAAHFDNDLPYENYLFLTHFVPKLYGGLEHLNSTALHFDGRKLGLRKEYLNYLSLIAHEYFHLWNVKRIRPKELGPFDYLQEGYTSLLWLSEGLTSFMDDLFVYRAGLSSLSEYLDIVKDNLETYFSIPGKKFHSLEQSSFNAWVKLYRPDENSKNSTISYYLKGGLVFMVLHADLLKRGKSVDDLLLLLWRDYKSHPETGLSKENLYDMIRTLGGQEVLERFINMVETTQEIDFEGALGSMGLECKWAPGMQSWIGADFEFTGERVFVKTVILDSPSYQAGLNAGDEILFLNGLRFLKEDADKLGQYLIVDQYYEFIVSRLNKLQRIEILPIKAPRSLKELVVVDPKLVEASFSFPHKRGPQ